MSDFAQWLDDALAYNTWTPDMPLIESRLDWYVFVYNKRRGKSSAYFTHIDSDAKYIGMGWTESSIYNILNVEYGKSNYHLAHPSGSDRILGEIWQVPSESIPELDGDELNELVSNRIMIPVVGANKTIYYAWIYVTNKDFLMKGGIKISKYSGYKHYGSDKFLELP